MKLITFLSLFYTCWSSVVGSEIYDDFTKIECSSSSTCTNPFCEIHGNELNNSISFGCKLQRTLSPVYVSMIFKAQSANLIKFSHFSSAYNFLSSKTMNLTVLSIKLSIFVHIQMFQ